MKLLLILLLGLMLSSCSTKIQEDQSLLENMLKSEPDKFGHILKNLEKHDVQVIYTQINRDSLNNPHFNSFYFNFDSTRYFYPASTVKLPVSLLALEKINELKIPELSKSSTMLTDSSYSGQTVVLSDSTSANNLPSIEHYIKKIFLVSDNDAFNRLYEFVGQYDINEKLYNKGYTDLNIVTRLAIYLTEEENRHTNPIRFYDNESLIYQQVAAYNHNPLPVKKRILKGKGHIKNGELIDEPMDFTFKNFFPLNEMQMMLRAVIFPNHVGKKYTFNLTEDDYRFLYQYMSQLPSESVFPRYDTSKYYDAYSKLLMYGNDKKPLPKHIRIFNKYGQSYGYLIDNAYVVDFKNNVEYLLSAVIQANENDIYNDNVYEYNEIAYPFMRDLGQLIYNYELARHREHAPDLSRFRVNYDLKH